MPEPRPPQPNTNLQKLAEHSVEIDSLDNLWEKEKKDGDPKIKFKIALGFHGGSKDIEFFRQDFKSCDIYLPEVANWSETTARVWGAISNGMLNAEEYINSYKKGDQNWSKNPEIEYHFAQMRLIANSKKLVAFVDLPLELELTDTVKEILSDISIKLGGAIDLKRKIAAMREYLVAFAEVIKVREKFIFKEIPASIKKILIRRPDLVKKPELKVLISMGAAHTPLYMMLKSVDPDIERSFPEMPFIFNHFERLSRALKFGKSIQDISDEEIERAILSRDVLVTFDKSRKKASETTGTGTFLNKVSRYVDMFSSQEIHELYEEIGKGRKFRDVFFEFLKIKGVDDKSL